MPLADTLFDEETQEFFREFLALDGVRVSILFYTSVAMMPTLSAVAFFGRMLGVSSGYSVYMTYREWDNLMEEEEEGEEEDGEEEDGEEDQDNVPN